MRWIRPPYYRRTGAAYSTNRPRPFSVLRHTGRSFHLGSTRVFPGLCKRRGVGRRWGGSLFGGCGFLGWPRWENPPCTWSPESPSTRAFCCRPIAGRASSTRGLVGVCDIASLILWDLDRPSPPTIRPLSYWILIDHRTFLVFSDLDRRPVSPPTIRPLPYRILIDQFVATQPMLLRQPRGMVTLVPDHVAIFFGVRSWHQIDTSFSADRGASAAAGDGSSEGRRVRRLTAGLALSVDVGDQGRGGSGRGHSVQGARHFVGGGKSSISRIFPGRGGGHGGLAVERRRVTERERIVVRGVLPRRPPPLRRRHLWNFERNVGVLVCHCRKESEDPVGCYVGGKLLLLGPS